jgi:hypothetical protein
MSSHYSVDLELMGMLYAIYLTGKWHGVSMWGAESEKLSGFNIKSAS